MNTHPNFLICFLLLGRCWIFSCLNKETSIHEKIQYWRIWIYQSLPLFLGQGMELIFQESFCISISFGRDCFFISCFSSCRLPSIIGVTPFWISKVSKIDYFQRQNHWLVGGFLAMVIISLMTYLTYFLVSFLFKNFCCQ